MCENIFIAFHLIARTCDHAHSNFSDIKRFAFWVNGSVAVLNGNQFWARPINYNFFSIFSAIGKIVVT